MQRTASRKVTVQTLTTLRRTVIKSVIRSKRTSSGSLGEKVIFTNHSMMSILIKLKWFIPIGSILNEWRLTAYFTIIRHYGNGVKIIGI